MSEQVEQEKTSETVEATKDTTTFPTEQTQSLSITEERTWAMLAHLSIFLNLVTGFFGPVAALLIYLVFKDRSKYVAYQSMQAIIFQLVFFIGGGVLIGLTWLLTGLLSIIIIGLFLIPLALIISLIPVACFVYAVYGAVETKNGKDFKYWLVGDWARGTLVG